MNYETVPRDLKSGQKDTEASIVYFFLTWTQSGTPVEISLCYFNNFNHPQRDWPISFRMKYVITFMNISTGLTQCGLIWGLRRDDFIMKLINLLIRELDNCSLGAIFESRAMPKFVNLIAFL